jgi:hypothetical protein
MDASSIIFQAKVAQARRESQDTFRRCFLEEFGIDTYNKLRGISE